MVSSELVLLTLVGHTFRLCRPSTCALIIADSILLVKGFPEIFLPLSFLLSPGSPSRLSRPDSRALGLDPSPFHRGTAARHSLVAAPRRVVYRPSAPSRPARVVTRSRWNHPLSMVLLYHTSTGLSRVFQKFLKIFLSSPHYLIFCDGGARACFSRLPTRFLAMVVNPLRFSGDLPPQGLYFATMASPCSATVGVPRRGWGPHPLLTMTLYHPYITNTIDNLGKFSTTSDIRRAGTNDGGFGI